MIVEGQGHHFVRLLSVFLVVSGQLISTGVGQYIDQDALDGYDCHQNHDQISLLGFFP